MIKHLLLCICFFSTFHFCLANTGWWFTGHKEGITIIVPCAYEDSVFERKQQEAFLNRLVEKLNRKDTSLKILLLVNPMIMYPGWGTENYWFATLGYDRLQEPDMEFIKDFTITGQKTVQEENIPFIINHLLKNTKLTCLYHWI